MWGGTLTIPLLGATFRQMNKKVMIGSATAIALALIIPIVGPFTFYPTLVPVLSPILPKRDGVPGYATASHSWKGFGLFWEWNKRYDSGCVEWGAAHSDTFVSTSLELCGEARLSAPLALKHWSYSHEIVFDRGDDWHGGDPCPFNVSAEEIADFRTLVREALADATPEIEHKALEQIEDRLDIVDGARLVTHHSGGCSDLRQ